MDVDIVDTATHGKAKLKLENSSTAVAWIGGGEVLYLLNKSCTVKRKGEARGVYSYT